MIFRNYSKLVHRLILIQEAEIPSSRINVKYKLDISLRKTFKRRFNKTVWQPHFRLLQKRFWI